MNYKKILILAVIAVLMIAFFAFDLGQYLALDALKQQQAAINALYERNPLEAIAVFFVLYVAVTGLSLPGATILTLASGAFFGLVSGTVIVSFASTLGATIAMLVSRLLLRDWVQSRYSGSLKKINQGLQRDGGFYLFTLRLVPVVPFFVINLALGVTKIRVITFAWVSQLGMLAGTIVFVNAGTQLAAIDSLQGILSPTLIGSFVLLGLFPWIARIFVASIKARKTLKDWPRPKRFDRDLVVIGAGSAGLVSAYIAAVTCAKVSLIEKHQMGGDCLNTGCVPSKALIRTAKLLHQISNAKAYGIREAKADFDFADVMDRVHRVIQTIEPHDSVERFTKLGVDCIQGNARITSPYTVEVNGRTLTTRNIIIAAGARPFVPPIPGLEEVGYYTSDTLWQLRELPRRLTILGGGPIGSELTQAFARLGAQVTQIEMLPRIMIREDPEVSDTIMQRFLHEGINVLVAHRALRFELRDTTKILVCEHKGQEVEIEFDAVLVAVGRAARTADYGLDQLGIPLTRTRTVEVDEYLQTKFPNILACGDVVGPYQFTHTASHQAWFATVNALFGSFKKFKVDYSVIPWATFTDPEVARVGLNETEAKEHGIAYEVTRYGIDDLDRAIADEEAHGFIKVLTVPGKDRILGVTIVGDHGGDLIVEYVAAMKHRFGLNKILGTIHIYPTLAEANKFAAGEWKRAHAPQAALRLAERYHRWRRKG